MRTSFVILVILGFVGIAVFGFAAMGHSGSHSGGCIAMAANGAKSPCPLLDPFGFVNFHIDIFQSFSSATIGTFYYAAFVIALTSILALIGRSSIAVSKSGVIFSRILPLQKIIFAEHFFIAKRKINSWISFHETSPTSF